MAAGFAPRISQEAESIQSLLALVAAGLGVAFVPTSVMDGSPRPGIAFRPLLPAPQIATALAWPSERPNPAVDAFRRNAMEASVEGQRLPHGRMSG